MPPRYRFRVAVFGAGAFGGWTALELARRGADVELIDAWAPGHARSSSGGETRVIRATYGTHVVYTEMAVRALQSWRRHEAAWGQQVFYRSGALWIFPDDDPFRSASAAALRSHGLPVEDLSIDEARERFPQVCFDGVAAVMFEPEAGYLMARQACGIVARCVTAEGGRVVQGAAPEPLAIEGRPSTIRVSDGRAVEADAFVFACGPWLPRLFPDVVGPLIQVTRQEVYYLGTPQGDGRFDAGLPVWLEFGGRFVYGIPGNAGRGFKVADDSPGPPMDPTTDDRTATAEGLELVRTFVGRRFPALARAPVVGLEVCQYESTPDANFVVDRHPRADNVWIVGGGSGHGFKMGPVIGEMVAAQVLGERTPDPRFALARLEAPPAGGWVAKWA